MMKDKTILKIIITITIFIVLCFFFYQKFYKIDNLEKLSIKNQISTNTTLGTNNIDTKNPAIEDVKNVSDKNIIEKIKEKVKTDNSKVFYGYSIEKDGSLVNFSDLESISSILGTSRTSIGTQYFNVKSSQYVYFAWPQSFEPIDGCSHDGITLTTCFMTPFGAYPVMIRSTQIYNGQMYNVYRAKDTGVVSNFTIN